MRSPVRGIQRQEKIAAEDETATRPQLAGVSPRMFQSLRHETMEQDL
jgi:hypothetical protein